MTPRIMAYSSVERPLFPADAPDNMGDEGLASEAQLILLCLDYLRDLRRSYSKEDLLDAEGINADFLSVSIYALSRCFVQPPELTNELGNDAMMDRNKANKLTPGLFPVQDPLSSKNYISIPNLNTINKEIFYSKNPAVLDSAENTAEFDNQDPTSWYTHDANHISNAHRFYPLEGLASGPLFRGPLSLGEITAAGLAGLGARCQAAADKEIKESSLFDQYASAVRAKGFFRDPDTEQPRDDPEEEKERLQRVAAVEAERLHKVVGKFRFKLATKAQQELDDNEAEGPPLSYDSLVMTAAARQENRRQARIEAAQLERNGCEIPKPPPKVEKPSEKPSLSIVTNLATKLFSGDAPVAAAVLTPTPRFTRSGKPLADVTQESTPTFQITRSVKSPSPRQDATPASQFSRKGSASLMQDHPLDIEEAERLKSVGNGHMQKKEFVEAAEAYTAALTLSPNGPNTHVYFSNRAAALLSMKKLQEAIIDSERSLALKPNYGKAHARLGLAHFLLGNYREAMQAYTAGLKYDPDNKSTKSYLEKAAKRLAVQEGNSRSSSARSSPLTPLEEMDERKKLINQKEAEKLKLKGNSLIANRDYQAALDAYSEALKLCPDGPNSHVYFSNRAAALCYLERYEEAEEDSEMSLMLVPNYGKAHARLGLSRFFMGDYSGAIEAYTAALKYDPDNVASKSYLAKARARLTRQNEHITASKVVKKVDEDPSLSQGAGGSDSGSLDLSKGAESAMI